MSIREDHSTSRQPIEVRRLDLAARIEALHVSVTQIIGKDVNDVGIGRPPGMASAPVAVEIETCNTRSERSSCLDENMDSSALSQPISRNILPGKVLCPARDVRRGLEMTSPPEKTVRPHEIPFRGAVTRIRSR
jgi:hypothetical protein